MKSGLISASFFSTLGVRQFPVGRNFIASEDKSGGERVAILSHGLWQRRYNGDQDIIGKTITLNDSLFTVVGVTPADFRYFRPFDALCGRLWRLIWKGIGAKGITSSQPTVARLKPGVTFEQARAELDTLAAKL